MVSHAAVAGGQDFTVRIPYAFGVICLAAGNTLTLSMLPVDSAMYNAPGHSGFAVRADDGTYAYYTSTVLDAIPANIGIGNCTGVAAPDKPITTLASMNGSPAGNTITVTATAAFNPAVKKGQIVFLYRRIRYQFKNSVALPGRTGLFRAPVDAVGATRRGDSNAVRCHCTGELLRAQQRRSPGCSAGHAG